MREIAEIIAGELAVKPTQVAAAVKLLDEGATVPFIARYRKEATNGLDDTQLRNLDERLTYLRELNERRDTILNSIKEQDKLTPELEKSILGAETKTALEDLYLPYKPKRRTKAQIAREAGLAPLAETLLADPTQDPDKLAEGYLNEEHGITTVKDALQGARQILVETFAENADLLAKLRDYLWQHASLKANVVSGQENAGKKFSDYFDYEEALKKIPSHRALALFRGRNEKILQLRLQLAESEGPSLNPCEEMIAQHFAITDQGRAADKWLIETVRWAFKIKLFMTLELELMSLLREQAESEAIRVFSSNLHDLLLSAPAGAKATMGLDPGLRTGVKVAIVDETGKLVAHDTIFPHAPKNNWDASLATLAKLCGEHQVKLISIGNGTASRETDKLAGELMSKHTDLGLTKIMVSEAGASVYSASEYAAEEFPDLDVSFRGAVSIARRLQDPLAELVKIEPKSIGVGQYQHDVNQSKLSKGLDATVEDCVNAVGVDLNRASVPLLARVAGLNRGLAKNIVAFRDEHGAFKNRTSLKDVPRLGEKAFEQAAGFLRITDGENPLDASAVHPEAYPVVEKIAGNHSRDIRGLLGDSAFLKKLDPANFTDEQFGLPTVKDILDELDKPGRDPRPDFRTATFKEGVEKISDLKESMILEGVVTNVTNFGAFVDIGVHQDGLVHISSLTNKFVKDPHDIVKAGDIVKVKVIEVDQARKRIGLTMRLEETAQAKPAAKNHDKKAQGHKPKTHAKGKSGGGKPQRSKSRAPSNDSLGLALAAAMKKQES